jgi:hypothetical protein
LLSKTNVTVCGSASACRTYQTTELPTLRGIKEQYGRFT